MFSRFQGVFTKILSRVLDRNFNCRRPGIIIAVYHKSINLNSPNQPLIYKYDVQFFFFAFLELLFPVEKCLKIPFKPRAPQKVISSAG